MRMDWKVASISIDFLGSLLTPVFYIGIGAFGEIRTHIGIGTISKKRTCSVYKNYYELPIKTIAAL